jgi:hypothetical protein
MLNELFEQLGHKPTATAPTRTTYKSPWNIEEKTASCYIFKNNQWNGQDPLREFNYKDNSSGNGGNIFHFIMNYFNISFVEAKAKITELTGQDPKEQPNTPTPKTPTSFSFNQQKEENPEKQYKIKKVSTLINKALENYLIERGLKTIEIHKKYLGEIYYQIEDKNYFALSFANENGGREIRNKYFKGSFGKKDISLVLPNPKDNRLKIFEGFIDFLSYLEINKNAPLSNYLILNSVSLKERGFKAIQGKFERLELYLDNDKAGDEATLFFMQNFNNSIDKRVHYSEHKDLNDFLLSM